MAIHFEGRASGSRRRPRPGAGVGCEALEGRELLTFGIGGALGFVQQIGGAIPQIQPSQGTPAGPTSTSGNAYRSAQAALQTEMHSLALESGVTVSDQTALYDALQADLKDIAATPRTTAGSTALNASLTALKTDLTSLAKGGTGAPTLATVESDELAVLTAAGASSADVATSQTALNAYVTDSGLTASDISTVYADQQAILTATPTHSRFGGFGFGQLFGRGNAGSTKAPAPTLDQVSGLLGIPISTLTSLPHRQGRSASTGTGLPTSPGTPPTPTAYQQAVTKLQTDLHDLALQSKVTVAQQTTLADYVQADAKAITTRPNFKTLNTDLNTLASDLQSEIKAGTFSLTTIQADETTILQALGVPKGADSTTQPSIARTLADQAAIVAASGITAGQLQTIYNDQQAIIAATPPRRHGGHR